MLKHKLNVDFFGDRMFILSFENHTCSIARTTGYTDNHVFLAQPDWTTFSDTLAWSIVFRWHDRTETCYCVAGPDKMIFVVLFSPDQPPQAVSKLL